MQSPGLRIREFDRTNIVGGGGNTSAGIFIKEPWKGQELEIYYVDHTDTLVNTFGYPTYKSKIDMLVAEGYLKEGNALRASCIRPQDSTFSDIRINSNYTENYYEDSDDGWTYTVSGSASDGEDSYSYRPLGITNLLEFPDMISDELLSTGSMFWVLSKWRGKSSRNIRVLFYDFEIYKAIKYFDTSDQTVEVPHDKTIDQEAIDFVETTLYPDFEDNPSDSSLLYPNIRNNLNNILENNYQIGVIIQEKDQRSDLWETKEVFLTSVDERDTNDSGEPLFIENVINNQSSYIVLALNNNYKTDYDIDNGSVKIATNSFVQLTKGYNGEWGRAQETSSNEGIEGAFTETLDLYNITEDVQINLFIDSGNNENIKRRIIELCEKRKDCLGILDVKKEHVINNRGNEANDITKWRTGRGGSTFNPNSSYAAIYGNWLEVFDRWNRRYEWVPASGHVAGIYARSDVQGEKWFSAGGLNRGILTNIRRLAWNPGQSDRDLLYVNQINPIVSFSGQGKVVWGNITALDKGSVFQFINIRRLFIELRTRITQAARYFIFEQIDDLTFVQLRNTIEPFLKTVRGRRGIQSFSIELGDELNTPETRARGEIWGKIYVVPVGVAENIYLDFIATKDNVSFTEITT